MLQIFIGYDSREVVAYHVLVHSILRRSSIAVSVAPVMRSQLRTLYTRERGPTESTEFSLSRFLVPKLSEFKGWSLYMDCDMLCRADVGELAALAQGAAEKAVLVCKHDYAPNPNRKFLNQVQTVYPRKNWSSVMLFNNSLCTNLTPDYVNSATPAALHRLQWTDDALIGEIPLEWNWLVGEYKQNPDAKIVHFTRGGPYFDEYRNCDYAAEWFRERELACSAANPVSA